MTRRPRLNICRLRAKFTKKQEIAGHSEVGVAFRWLIHPRYELTLPGCRDKLRRIWRHLIDLLR